MVLLATPVFAREALSREAEILGAETLYDGLDDEAQALLEDISPETGGDFGKSLWKLVTDVLSDLHTPLREALETGGRMLAVLLLCALCEGLEPGFAAPAARLGGAFGLTAVCAGSLEGMLSLATGTLDRIGDFTTLLMPVLSAALTASGGITGGTALYVGSMLFFDVLVRLIKGLLIPMTYAFVAVAAAECAMGDGRLASLRELLGWGIQLLLKGVIGIFTAYLALSGVINGSADAASVKAAGSVLSTAVPVVGSMLSEAAASLLAGASLVRSTVGAFGLAAILAIGLAPFLRIGTHYLILKLTAAVGGMMGGGANAKLMNSLSSAMGYMLAMTGSCLLMALLSCCCFMKAVSA